MSVLVTQVSHATMVELTGLWADSHGPKEPCIRCVTYYT